MKNKARKASWLFLDLAFKIQVAPRHHAAKLVLLFLAKTANNSGRSYHGYRSISAHLQLGHSAIHTALVYLRDLGILTWEQGGGGFQKRDTNDYILSLPAMTALVEAQGVFSADGKLIRSAICTPDESESHFRSAEPTANDSDGSRFHSAEPTEPKSIPFNGKTVVSTERAVVSTERKVVSTERQSPLFPAEHNPQKSNPQIKQPTETNPRPGPSFLRIVLIRVPKKLYGQNRKPIGSPRFRRPPNPRYRLRGATRCQGVSSDAGTTPATGIYPRVGG